MRLARGFSSLVVQNSDLLILARIAARRANLPERGCVRSTSRSGPAIPTRCGWVSDHSRAPYWWRRRRGNTRPPSLNVSSRLVYSALNHA